MTTEEAVDLMRTSNNVREWNINRETVNRTFGYELPEAIRLQIDGLGLIKEVLKKKSAPKNEPVKEETSE